MIPVSCQRVRLGGTVSGSSITGGTSIQTRGIFLSSLAGLTGHPGRRGFNAAIPYLDGNLRRARKPANPRQLLLSMEIMDRDQDGNITHPQGRRGHWEANMDTFLALIDAKGESVIVERDMADGSTRWIEAEIINPFGFEQGDFFNSDHATYVGMVPLEAHYPYWQTKALTTTAFGVGFTPAGNATLASFILEFTSDGTWVHTQSGDTITINGSTGTVLVDVGRRRVTQAGVLAPNLITHNRAHWARLPAFTAATFSGTATGNVLHRGTYL